MSQHTDLYDTDFFLWTQAQAALLRDGKARDLDWSNLAEEIESVGRSQKHAIRSQLVRLLLHLLKWRYEPSHHGHSWQDSITDARTQIALTIEDSPSLRDFPRDALAFAYRHARRKASLETHLPLQTFPDTCPWDVDQVLDDTFLPEG
jgi:hypothetical protein